MAVPFLPSGALLSFRRLAFLPAPCLAGKYLLYEFQKTMARPAIIF